MASIVAPVSVVTGWSTTLAWAMREAVTTIWSSFVSGAACRVFSGGVVVCAVAIVANGNGAERSRLVDARNRNGERVLWLCIVSPKDTNGHLMRAIRIIRNNLSVSRCLGRFDYCIKDTGARRVGFRRGTVVGFRQTFAHFED
ncbi:hypothetical protein [Novosphingobium nitrogenifigens]|uniref:hypothetical protein n=1 Tax=Novosphingobium nitrogenifigens TaxID=378548 RepID=UPI001E57F051|nr:hypothetical protein [Novosphingobium nitrogenifigens]